MQGANQQRLKFQLPVGRTKPASKDFTRKSPPPLTDKEPTPEDSDESADSSSVLDYFYDAYPKFEDMQAPLKVARSRFTKIDTPAQFMEEVKEYIVMYMRSIPGEEMVYPEDYTVDISQGKVDKIQPDGSYFTQKQTLAKVSISNISIINHWDTLPVHYIYLIPGSNSESVWAIPNTGRRASNQCSVHIPLEYDRNIVPASEHTTKIQMSASDITRVIVALSPELMIKSSTIPTQRRHRMVSVGKPDATYDRKSGRMLDSTRSIPASLRQEWRRRRLMARVIEELGDGH